MGPVLTSVGGGCKADTGTPAIKEAALLESGNNRIAKGKGVRFDFRLVITGGVAEGVATNLCEVPPIRIGEGC